MEFLIDTIHTCLRSIMRHLSTSRATAPLEYHEPRISGVFYVMGMSGPGRTLP